MESTVHSRVRFILPVLFSLVFTSCSTLQVYGFQEPAFSTARVALNSGNTAPVTKIVQDSRAGYVFTASQDGTVKIWDLPSHSMLETVRVSAFRLVSLAVNPERPEFAVVETDGALFFQLSVWNWQTGRRLFDRTLSEVPLSFQFSPRGNFLVYSLTQWNSLVFLDSENGRELNYLPGGFGIVRFAIVSPTERTLMSYTPSSGSLIYWDLPSGTQKAAPIPTQSGLTDLKALNDLYAVGVNGTKLVVINILTGAVASERELGKISSISVNSQTQDIAVAYQPPAATLSALLQSSGSTGGNDNNLPSGSSGGVGGAYVPAAANLPSGGSNALVALFSFANGGLSEEYFAGQMGLLSEPSGTPTAMLLLGGNILFGRPDGSLALLYQYSGSVAGFSSNHVRPIDDIAFTDKNIFICTNQDLLNLTSDFFDLPDAQIGKVSYIRENVTRNPYQSNAGLASTLYGQIFLWRHDDQSGSFYMVDPRTLEVSDLYDRFDAPLLQLQPAANTLLTLDRSGHIRVINGSTYDTSYTLTSVGTQTVADAGDYGILIGRNTSSVLDSSLVRVSSVTGETVPVNNDSFLVFRIVYDSENNRAFTVGLRQDGQKVSTVVRVHSGVNFGQSTEIMSYHDEDLGGDIAYDSSTGTLYSSVGYGTITAWDGAHTSQLQPSKHVPRKLVVHGSKLYAINRDGSLSVWDTRTRQFLFDFYMLEDSSWLAITPDGYYLPASYGNPEQYLSLVRFDKASGSFVSPPGSSDTPQLADFRLKLAKSSTPDNRLPN